MKRIESIRTLEVESVSATEAVLTSPGDVALVRRGRLRLLAMQCPCGCGDTVRVNLDRRAGPAWYVHRGPAGQLTVYPSIWRDSGCCSHFIVSRDTVYLFERGDHSVSSESTWSTRNDVDGISVLAQLTREFSDPTSIADVTGMHPWDVVAACRALVRSGQAIEHPRQVLFRRARD